MKRLLAISLLLVHLFNLSGYAFVFQYLTHQSDEQLTKKIDAGRYDRSELILLKVAMQLPYGNDWAQFERVNGVIEVAGVPHNYVERKISRDTVYLLCLPNEGKAKLTQEKTAFAKAAADVPNGKQKAGDLLKKGFPGLEYSQLASCYLFSVHFISRAVHTSFLMPHNGSVYLSTPFSPPDRA